MNQIKVTTDNELIETILSTSASISKNQAYTLLYDRYSQVVKTYVRNYLSTADDFTHEEIISEVVIKILTKIHLYSNKYPFKAWALSITKNCIIDFLRKRKMNTISLDNIEIENPVAPDVILEAKETSRSIQKFISEQKESYQEILRLRFEYGSSCKAIAARLQMPVGTISTILFRSRIRLKESGIIKY